MESPSHFPGQRRGRLVVVVGYNQEIEIASTLEDLGRYVPPGEIVVIDDGSSDRSASIAETAGHRVVRHATNRGVGAAIRTGIRLAQSMGKQYVVIFSANGKMVASDVPRVSAPIEEDRADYVQGSRFAPGGRTLHLPWVRYGLIKVFSLLSRVVLGRSFTDITCGLRAYRVDWLAWPRADDVDIDQAWLDRYELEYYVHYQACRKQLRIVEVPVTIRYSHLTPGRLSKIRLHRQWWSIVRPFVLLPLGMRR